MEINTINDVKNGIENANRSTMPLKEQAVEQLNQILTLLPNKITDLIENAFTCKRVPKEYLVSSILYSYSNAAGLAFKMNALGHDNFANIFVAIVGSRGDAKSVAIDLATDPLNHLDSQNYTEYEKLKSCTESPESVNRKQLFLQDATIEAAMFAHSKNKLSIGILVDELFGLIQRMASKNSNEGSMWRTFFLQGYNNRFIEVSRKTTDSYRIEKSYPTLLGSIQKEFIPQLFANGNLDSGLIDRILFTTKLTKNNILSNLDISPAVKQNYDMALKNLYNYRKFNEEQEGIVSTLLSLTENANSRLMKYVQKLINEQEFLGNILFQYNAKMQISIHKLIILVHLISQEGSDTYKTPIPLDTVELAILINEFYFTNFRIILEENLNHQNKEITLDELITYAKKSNKTQKDVVEFTNYNKSTVSRHWTKN